MMQQSKKSGVVRIIGGNWRGRNLKFTCVDGLRPSLDRTRETLFNWLARDIYSSNCLDLFAGSGALGFEAASRGAKKVTLVESHKKVADNLKKNCEILNASQINVINRDAKKFLEKNSEKFDLIFLDPPFGKGFLFDILQVLETQISSETLIYIERECQKKEEQAFVQKLEENYRNIKLKKTSRFSYGLYQLISK